MASNEKTVASNHITASEFAEIPKSAKKQWHTPELQTLEIEATAGGLDPAFIESTFPGIGS
jgi:hypothetical protein